MYLTDNPIQKIEDDELGRKIFVEELAQSLLSRDITESLVISLDGPWGSGKSSVLNLLETDIKSNNPDKTTIFRFDPWYFNSTEKLLQSFLDEINRIIEKKIPGKKIKQKIAKYKKILTSVQFAPKVSFFGVELSLGNFDVNLENPDSIRNDIKNLIVEANTRVIILIDNLDRLDITELLLIFKLVRLCGDFPGFTFVLALDKKQILKLLEESNLSFEFIDKIIQVDIKLPAIEQYRINDFLSKGLEYIANAKRILFDDLFWSRFSQIYQNTIAPKLMTTLRDAKRFLNTADFSLPIVKGEVNYADFLILQVLRVFYPDIYELIPQFKSELTQLVIGESNFKWMQKDKIAVFNELTERIQTTLGSDNKIANDLLGFLFPNYGAFIQNPQNPSIQTYTNDYEKQQLIASSAYFDRYFTMKVAGDDIPTSAILEFVDRLNTQGDSLNFQDQFFSKYQETNNLILAIKKLDLYVDKIKENAKLHIIGSFSNSSITFDTKRKNYLGSEILSAKKLVTDCILSFNENRQIDLIREVILKSPSLLYSFLIAHDSVMGRWFPFSDEIRKILLEVIRDRVHKDLVNEKIDIFDGYPIGFSTILNSWRNKDFLNEEELAKQYTKEFLEKKPEHAIRILSTFVWVYAGTETPSDFGFGDFSSSYDPKEFKGYLEKLDLSTLSLSEGESFAVKEFKRLYP